MEPSRKHETGRRSPRRAASARRGRGQSVVEFAIILPVLLFVTLGVVDFARVFSSYISLTNAVREGALYAGGSSYTNWCGTGSIPGQVPCPAGTAAANKSANPTNVAYKMSTEAVSMNAADIVMLAPQCSTNSNADFTTNTFSCTTVNSSYLFVKVTGSYEVPLITPFMGALFGGAAQLSFSTVASITASS